MGPSRIEVNTTRVFAAKRDGRSHYSSLVDRSARSEEHHDKHTSTHSSAENSRHDLDPPANDIAEQTNVLALNAAIQAASSGSGGKGFGVVADEVQRLAESATAATRRISSLVQTIQADTAEAVASMENTTSEVVNGAQLAQDAGQALVHIERVSNELKGLIQEVSGEALSQSKNAERIAELMDGIREVSLKTAKGTSQSAESVARLAAMVLTLRDSVADFKLPEDG
jgi:twitching motility protein PilJ